MAFFDKNDIPGENTFMPSSLYPQNEELFCSGVVQFFSQPVGIMVCKTQKLAELAAELVEITYDLAATKPLLNVRDVLSVGVGATDRITKAFCIEAATKGLIAQFNFFFCLSSCKFFRRRCPPRD